MVMRPRRIEMNYEKLAFARVCQGGKYDANISLHKFTPTAKMVNTVFATYLQQIRYLPSLLEV